MSTEPNKETTPRVPRKNKCHVLLVGFSSEETCEIAEALCELEWPVTAATDSHDALVKLGETEFDFVLIDVDGIDQFAPAFIDACHKGPTVQGAPTIVGYCAHFAPGFKRLLVNSGIQGFMKTPLSTAHLVTSLTKAAVTRATSGTGERPWPYRPPS